MGIIIRQSIKASIFSYIGILIGFVNVLFLYPKFLGEGNIGIIETIKAIVSLLSPFALFGVTSSLIKFFPEYSRKGKDNGFYLGLGLILVLWLSVFFSVLIIFKDEFFGALGYGSTTFTKYAWLVFPALFSWILFHFLSIVSNSSMRITVPRIMDSVVLRVLILLLVILFGISYITLETLIISMSVVYIVPALIMLFYVLKMKMINWKINADLFKKENFNPIFKYSRYTVFGAASAIIVQKIDVVMIGVKEDLASVGIYVIAFYIGSVIEIPKRNISDISFPILSKAFKEKDMGMVNDIYKQSSINQFIVGGFLLIVIWSCLDNVFMLMPDGEVYSTGKYVVIFIGIAKLFDMLMGVNKQIIQASNFYRFNLYTNIILSVLVVVFNLIFIPIFSIVGAAVASMLAMIIYNIVSYLVVWKQLKIQPLSKHTFTLLLIIIVIFTVGIFLPDLDSAIISIIYKGTLLSVLFGTSIYFSKVSPEANNIIDNVFSKIKS
jgi:O-antigen/teichoic acid export membrane protein